MGRKISKEDRIVLWQGAALWAFDILPQLEPRPNRTHKHHAFQITIAGPNGHANILTEEGLFTGSVVLIAPDFPHAIKPEGRIALLFVEPESRAGFGLRRILGDRSAASLPPMPEVVRELDPIWNTSATSDPEMIGIGKRVLELLLGPQVPDFALDPRISRVLDWLAKADERAITSGNAASVACLSKSRFSHLFVEETGLPFRSYVLWCRLMKAVQWVAAGDNLTAAAHHAGFADSAHFSRTFHRMFGVAADTMWLRSPG